MTKNYKIAGVLYGLNAVILLVIGLTFVFTPTFFPFHRDVIQTDWNALETPFQTLYLGMMRTEGAGYLASAFAIGFLLAVAFRKKELWSAWAIATIGITEHIPTFLANLHVARSTPATPPWFFVAACILSLLLGLTLTLTSK